MVRFNPIISLLTNVFVLFLNVQSLGSNRPLEPFKYTLRHTTDQILASAMRQARAFDHVNSAKQVN
jgi:hypothetical protein